MYPSHLFLHYLREGNYPKFFASDSEAPEATARQEGRHKTEEVTERTYSTSVSPQRQTAALSASPIAVNLYDFAMSGW
jgi:hypothetical protein